jgi:hypothetical protein
MKIEDQVCALEQAKKLKELGIEQNSIFYFSNFFDIRQPEEYRICRREESGIFHDRGGSFESFHFSHHKSRIETTYSAFAVAELGQLLIIGDDTYFIDYAYNEHFGQFQCFCRKRDERCSNGFRIIYTTDGDTEAECRADMLMLLLAVRIINAEGCNKRLSE